MSLSSIAVPVPWFWSGWEKFIKEENSSLLTRSMVFEGRFDENSLNDATDIWVDFFPDELSAKHWDSICQWAGKMIFLPPRIELAARVHGPSTKRVFMSDRQVEGLMPPDQEIAAGNGEVLTWNVLPINPKCFEKSFNFRLIGQLSDIEECINAPGWILMCEHPQNEHAFLNIARSHGIKVSFWQRPYSSPMRYFDGIGSAFYPVVDQNTRSRWTRSVNAAPLELRLAENYSWKDVKSFFSYRALRLTENGLKSGDSGRIPLRSLLHNNDFVSRLAEPHALLPLVLACEKLGLDSESADRDALLKRSWDAVCAVILNNHEDTARRWWMMSLVRFPAETLGSTRRVLDALISAKVYVTDVIRELLRALIYYQIKTPASASLLEYLEGVNAYWLNSHSTATEWEAGAWLNLLLGKSRWESLPAGEEDNLVVKDTWLLEGVARMRAGAAEEGLTLIRRDLQRKSLSSFGYGLVVKTLFDCADPYFYEFLPFAVENIGIRKSEWHCMMSHGCAVRNEQWRRKHLKMFERLTLAIESSIPKGERIEILPRIILGRGEQAKELLSREKRNYSESDHVVAALYFFIMGQPNDSLEMLEKMEGAPLPDHFLGMLAVLQHILGLRTAARDNFNRLKFRSPNFWHPIYLENQLDDRMFLLGLLGKAAGDEEMLSYALKRLDLPLHEHRRIGLGEISRMPFVDPVEDDLRSWMMKEL